MRRMYNQLSYDYYKRALKVESQRHTYIHSYIHTFIHTCTCSVGSQKVTFPPYPSTACTFTAGHVLGMTRCAGMPHSFAASATAWAWFPLLCVTAIGVSPPSSREEHAFFMALTAPRTCEAETHNRWGSINYIFLCSMGECYSTQPFH